MDGGVVLALWDCGSEWLGGGRSEGEDCLNVYSGWCCGRNIFGKIYMLSL